jgi:hypothetical protein
MSELIITNDARQLVITRLVCINSAVSVFSLLHGRPAKASIEGVLHLAERLEAWAWRGLLPDAVPTQGPEASPPQAPPDTPPSAPPPVSARGQVRLRARSNGRPSMLSASAGVWTAPPYRLGCTSSWGRRWRP